MTIIDNEIDYNSIHNQCYYLILFYSRYIVKHENGKKNITSFSKI